MTGRGRVSSIAGMIGLSLVVQAASLSAQTAMNTSYDRVILGGVLSGGGTLDRPKLRVP